jgi:hypothetical protein
MQRLVAFLFGAAICSSALAEKPNILFLFADDFTYDAISVLGRTDIETPNLDRLARRGTILDFATQPNGRTRQERPTEEMQRVLGKYAPWVYCGDKMTKLE